MEKVLVLKALNSQWMFLGRLTFFYIITVLWQFPNWKGLGMLIYPTKH